LRKEKLSNDPTRCLILGFHCDVEEICVLLIQDIVYNNKMYVTFCHALPGSLVLSQERIKQYIMKVLIMFHGVTVKLYAKQRKCRPTLKAVPHVKFVVMAKNRSMLSHSTQRRDNSCEIQWQTKRGAIFVDRGSLILLTTLHMHLPCECPQLKLQPVLMLTTM
jgi:hypothetical protein